LSVVRIDLHEENHMILESNNPANAGDHERGPMHDRIKISAPSRRSLLITGLAGGLVSAFHVPVRAANEPGQDHPTFGRYAEIPLDQMTAEQRRGYEYVMRERNRCPGPYKIWVENPSIMDLMVPLGAYYTNQSGTKQSSLNDTEIKIATVITCAKWGAAFAIGEQESFAEGKGGFSTAVVPAEKVERMIIGLPVSFDDPRQQAIYDVSTALLNSRYVPRGLYDQAVKLLGNNGVTDLTVLIGYFTMVSLPLMFHDVPSHAEGIKR
jgi:4-carboxymuconolactone decarboxylase